VSAAGRCFCFKDAEEILLVSRWRSGTNKLAPTCGIDLFEEWVAEVLIVFLSANLDIHATVGEELGVSSVVTAVSGKERGGEFMP
jgi:hypothetical protein